MKYSLMPSTKKIFIPLVILSFAFPIKAQTIVQVYIDQPEKMEITISDDMFSERGNTLVFGENISLSGGTSPFVYSWLNGETVIGTGPVLELSGPLLPGSYSLFVTDANNCSIKFLVTNNDELVDNNSPISVYPVPASKSITVDPNELQGILNATIYNNSGTVVLKKQIEGRSLINIDLPAGIYHIKVENNSRQIVGLNKIIVL